MLASQLITGSLPASRFKSLGSYRPVAQSLMPASAIARVRLLMAMTRPCLSTLIRRRCFKWPLVEDLVGAVPEAVAATAVREPERAESNDHLVAEALTIRM